MTEPRRMATELGSDAPTMARGALVNVSGALLATLLSFALNLLITHLVAVGRFGLFSIATTVVLISQVPGALGLDTGAVRFVALGAARSDEQEARGAFQAAFVAAAAASAALAVALVWEAPWLTEHAFHKPQAAYLVRIVALSLPALVLARVVTGALQGLGLMRYAARLSPVGGLLNVVAAAALLAVGLDVRGLAYAAVATAWGTLLVGLLLLLRAQPAAFVPLPRSWAVRRLLRFSLPQTLTTTLLTAILWTDTLLLGRLRSAADVGVYIIVQRLLSPGQTISTSVGQMLAPRIAAGDARGDRSVLALMLKRVTYWNVALSVPVFGALLLLPGPILRLFGPTYARGATALAILAAGQLVNAATGPLGQVINMSGRPYVTMANNAAVAAANVAGCLLLIPRFGVTGAALSTTGAITLVNAIKLVQVRVIFGIDPFHAGLARTLLAALVAAAVAAPLAFAPPWPGPLARVAAAVLVLVAAYLLAFWAVAASEEDRALLRGRLRRGPAPRPSRPRGHDRALTRA